MHAEDQQQLFKQNTGDENQRKQQKPYIGVFLVILEQLI